MGEPTSARIAALRCTALRRGAACGDHRGACFGRPFELQTRFLEAIDRRLAEREVDAGRGIPVEDRSERIHVRKSARHRTFRHLGRTLEVV
ncbi:hypothetical protein [Methyloraptor flagellatus]|uniref:Uncharacterized protein n=1 Tax=Methyloraptor flagellatus TaxID=3162530 RepID=A0AAU7X7P8_9HYPH